MSINGIFVGQQVCNQAPTHAIFFTGILQTIRYI